MVPESFRRWGAMGTIIRGLKLRYFRGIVRGDVDLAPLTILVGPNNSGKTTVLEALLLAHGFRDIAGLTIFNILSAIHRTLRSFGVDHLVYSYGAKVRRAAISYIIDSQVKSLAIDVSREALRFYHVEDLDADKLLEVSELVKIGREVAQATRFTLSEWSVDDSKLIADVLLLRDDIMRDYQDFIYNAWIDLANIGVTSEVAQWISRVVGEDYLDIVAEPVGGQHTLLLYKSDRTRVRLGDVGDGAQILVTARILVDYLKPEVVLWDDIESHMNPRALQLLALWLSDLVDSGKQVIVSTHSIEGAKLILELAPRAALVRLELKNGVLEAKRVTAEELEKLEELGVDVRV